MASAWPEAAVFEKGSAPHIEEGPPMQVQKRDQARVAASTEYDANKHATLGVKLCVIITSKPTTCSPVGVFVSLLESFAATAGQ